MHKVICITLIVIVAAAAVPASFWLMLRWCCAVQGD